MVAERDDGPIGDDVPPFGSEDLSIFECAIRRNISGNWSLASDVWWLGDESTPTAADHEGPHSLVGMFYHRDSISRIRISTQSPWVDADVRVEVFAPLPKDEAAAGPDEDANDITVADNSFRRMGESVWFAEYFARNIDGMIPDDPATTPCGKVTRA